MWFVLLMLQTTTLGAGCRRHVDAHCGSNVPPVHMTWHERAHSLRITHADVGADVGVKRWHVHAISCHMWHGLFFKKGRNPTIRPWIWNLLHRGATTFKLLSPWLVRHGCSCLRSLQGSSHARWLTWQCKHLPLSLCWLWFGNRRCFQCFCGSAQRIQSRKPYLSRHLTLWGRN